MPETAQYILWTAFYILIFPGALFTSVVGLFLAGVDRKVIAHMQEHGVPVMIYYPVPLHEQKAYQDPRYKKGDFPVSEELCQHCISLPMHTELDDEQIAHITSHLIDAVNRY